MWYDIQAYPIAIASAIAQSIPVPVSIICALDFSKFATYRWQNTLLTWRPGIYSFYNTMRSFNNNDKWRFKVMLTSGCKLNPAGGVLIEHPWQKQRVFLSKSTWKSIDIWLSCWSSYHNSKTFQIQPGWLDVPLWAGWSKSLTWNG